MKFFMKNSKKITIILAGILVLAMIVPLLASAVM